MNYSDKNIVVLGCGSWGGTVAQLLAENEYKLKVWHKFPNELERMDKTRRHPFIPELVFSENIEFTGSLEYAIADTDLIIIAVPSHIVRTMISEISAYIPTDAIIVNLSKGIENDSLMTMSQVIHASGGIEYDRIVTLSGPSHAEEVARQVPTTLVAASSSMETAHLVQHIFANHVMRVYTNNDILGVELGGSLKNVIAIASGICDGIGFGDNTKAALLTRGIVEITRLGLKMGAERETFAGLSGIGDLIVTCLSKHSRNRYVGEEIGKGRSLDEILSEMKMVAEGVKTATSVHQLVKKYEVEMPISEIMYKVLFKDLNPVQAVRALMTRDLKDETTG
ncbi:MAG: NAD(P)H-dependent glycerol-3-phosphate dehydrogenase [Candidatus Marinimicrobia bacterium]|nr:NAD(P)H-dependent glycerol-3-phosphate dehydrogenase [Candidatus Neomarinimicrobiota bacterium]